MTSKPETVSQEAWDAACNVCAAVRGVSDMSSIFEDEAAAIIALAIMAAKAEERANLPDEIDLFRFLKSRKLRRRGDIAKAIAAAIRKRGGE